MMGNKKKIAVAMGILMGISGSFFAMIPSSHHTEAAIAVIDQRNIEEAIKTAIQTANILNEEQKKYALMLLHLKKIDGSVLQSVMNDVQKQNLEKNKRDPLSACNQVPDSILNYQKATVAAWVQGMGDMKRVLNGEMTVYDMYQSEQKRKKALADTYEQTFGEAEKAIKYTADTDKTIEEGIKQSNEAEGEMQAMQAGNIIAAGDAQHRSTQTKLLARILAVQSATSYDRAMKEAQENAINESAEKSSRASLEARTDEDRQKALDYSLEDNGYY